VRGAVLTNHHLTASARAPGQPAGKSASRTIDESRSNAPILFLVESAVLVRIPVAEYLRSCGYVVVECAHAEEAIKLLEAGERADILLSDVALSGATNGFALARWVRQQHPAVKVLLASGAANLASTSGKICADGPIIAKPYALDTLLARLKQLRSQL
jgi:CheY-like chemotaxis protein